MQPPGFFKFVLHSILMKRLTFFSLLIFFSCSKEESINSPIEVPNENTFQFELDLSSEFPVAHDVGLNYFNDITVGVISNSSDAIKIITAANTSSYVLSGTSLSNINQATKVAAPQDNTFYSDYVGLGQLIKDSNNTIYSVFHSEQHDGSVLPGNIPGFYASVGLGISYDNGETFQLNSEPLIQNTFDINYDNGFGDGGLGEPSITFSKDRSEVFVYYVDHNRSGRGVNICMVKFLVDQNGAPDFSTCYYLNENKQFTSDVIRSKEVVAGIGYADAIFPHVSYNSFIDKYVMVYSLNHYGEFHNGSASPSQSGIYYRESIDGINWTDQPIKLITDWSIPYSFDNHSFAWHPNLIYSNDSQSEGYLVYSKASTLKQGHKMWAMNFKYSQN